MEGETDIGAGPSATDVADLLAVGDPEATAWVVRSWVGAVHGYCATVCQPDFAVEATAIAFADLFEKVERRPIDDAHLEPALMRSTRLAAADGAILDEDEELAETAGFDCEMTPLFLAGSPRAPAHVEVLRRMDDHVDACPRCQATERRFAVAEDSFLASREAGVREDVLEAVLDRLSIPHDPPEAEPEAESRAATKPAEVTMGVEPDGDPDTDEIEALEPGADTSELEGEEAPSGDRRRLSRKWVAVAAGLAAAAVIALVVGLVGGSSDDGDGSQERPSSAEKSEAPQRRARPKPRPSRVLPVALEGAKAVDFDPNGGNGERPDQVANVIDGNPKSAWPTELYPVGGFGRGVGVYIALPRPVALRGVEVRSSTPGWGAEIYGASAGPPTDLPAPGWKRLGDRREMRGLERIPVGRGAKPIRYCLIWVARLPSDNRMVSIGEVRLLAVR